MLGLAKEAEIPISWQILEKKKDLSFEKVSARLWFNEIIPHQGTWVELRQSTTLIHLLINSCWHITDTFVYFAPSLCENEHAWRLIWRSHLVSVELQSPSFWSFVGWTSASGSVFGSAGWWKCCHSCLCWCLYEPDSRFTSLVGWFPVWRSGYFVHITSTETNTS